MRAIVLALSIVLAGPATPQDRGAGGADAPIATPAAAPDWRLVWADEFNGDALNAACWRYWVDNPYAGAKELQRYTERGDNIVVKDGALHLMAREQGVYYDGAVHPYSSGQLQGKDRAAWRFGKIEARMKLPRGKGLWPAFWMFPQASPYGGWPVGGEIDIMEVLGHEPRVTYVHIHGPKEDGEGHWSTGSWSTGHRIETGKDLSKAFHVYGLEWTPETLRFFLDRKQIAEISRWHPPKGAAFPAPFDQHFFIILNLAVGGDWAGAPDAKTRFPATLLVDYVRVYQDANLPPGPPGPLDTTSGSIEKPFRC